MPGDDHSNLSARKVPNDQLIIEYQIIQSIADHEVQTIYLSFAVFIPILITAAASLIAVLISGNLENESTFVALGVSGTVVTFLMIWGWWRVADRRQQIRKDLFDYQGSIAKQLGGYMIKQKLFAKFETEKRAVLPFLSGDATFVNLMKVAVWFPLGVWIIVLVVGIIELSKSG